MQEFNLKLDYYGVLNLHKALLEAKFNLNPDNELVSGSPLAAEMYIQIREFLIHSEELFIYNEEEINELLAEVNNRQQVDINHN